MTSLALGIFGRLDPLLEQNFNEVQTKYYQIDQNAEVFGVFPHLTLAVGYNVPANDLSSYKKLLQELTTQLPLVIRVAGVKVIDDKNLAFAFDISQTKQIRSLANAYLPRKVIATDYFTVMRSVPPELQDALSKELEPTRTLTFTDFVLCANRVDASHILHSATEL